MKQPPKKLHYNALLIVFAIFCSTPFFAQQTTGDVPKQALPAAHYIIQLTCFEINMWSNRDDINIHVTSQTTSTFDVLIHEGDNGANGNASRDKDWHFVVTDF
tara:strand:- start:5368 stop:5676 length:309 start_codon:yes stop_codon:yes gene_type:complete